MSKHLIRNVRASEINGLVGDDGAPAVRNTIQNGLAAGMKNPREPKSANDNMPRLAPAAVTATPHEAATHRLQFPPWSPARHPRQAGLLSMGRRWATQGQ